MKLSSLAKFARDEQIEHLRAHARVLEREATQLRRDIGSKKEFLAQVRDAVMISDPLPRVDYRAPAKPGSAVIPVFAWSDLHVGEKVNGRETEGFGSYDWKICQRRAGNILDAQLRWIDTARYGYKIDECFVVGIGDYISGDIHRELSVTNEWPVPVQTAKAGWLLAYVAARYAQHFSKVTFVGVGADNHSRMNPKPQAKQKTANSFSYLVHEIAKQALSKHGNLEFIAAEAAKYLAEINGWRFLIEHGDAVKAWMGIPLYGIERESAREAMRRMNTRLGFHYQMIGHWHVAGFPYSRYLMNGSLSGTTEYDHIAGRHSRPAQIAFLTHRKHGVFNFVPFGGR